MEEDFDFEEEEDEEQIDNDKHWKSLSIASAVISVICILIIIAIILLTPSDDPNKYLKPYSLDEVITKKLIKGHHFNGTWISDYEFIYQTSDRNIVLYNCQHNSATLIANKLNTTSTEIIQFDISKSRTFLLIKSKKAKIRTHQQIPSVDCNSAQQYLIYDLRNGNILNLEEEFNSRNGKRIKTKEEEEIEKSEKMTNKIKTPQNQTNSQQQCLVQSAEWAPLGDELFIMARNDIYRFDLNKPNQVDRLTLDGSLQSSIFNGYNDYIYREFIFGKSSSLLWSKNNSPQYLCFMKINNSQVPVESVTIYPDESSSQLRQFRYPTINSPIGDASLWITNLNTVGDSKQLVPIKPPAKVQSNQHYITYVDWTPNDELLVVWTLRNQRRSIVGLCSASDNWVCREQASLKNFLELKHLSRSILPATTGIGFKQNSTAGTGTADQHEYFLCGQVPETGDKTFYQLYSLNANTKVVHSFLNMAERIGDFQYYKVSELLAYNDNSKLVFFVGQSLSRSDSETLVTDQDMLPNIFVFSITYGTVHCLTCQMENCHQMKQSSKTNTKSCIDPRNSFKNAESNDNREESCLFKSAHFSPLAKYAIISCLNGILPQVYLVKFSDLNNASSQMDIIENIILFDDNSNLKERIATKIIPNVESFVFSREYNNILKYQRIKILAPLDFSNEHISKYPFIFQFYPPGLNLQNAVDYPRQRQDFHTEKYPDTEWAIYMVTKHNIVYGWLDGQLAEDYNHSTRQDTLDELIDDYQSVLDFILSNMTFVNFKQTCLLGNNIGGSLILQALSLPSTPIDCGIVMSPIIYWNSINSLIAEQYLNLDRFKSNDLSYLLKMSLNYQILNKKSLLLIHGTSNELVPISQTMQLMKRLTFDAQDKYTKENNNNSSSSSSSSGSTTSDKDDEDQQNIIYYTNHQYLEAYINQDNSFDAVLEHLYRKIESFLFKFVIASA